MTTGAAKRGAAQYTGESVKRSPAVRNKFVAINEIARRHFRCLANADARTYQDAMGRESVIFNPQTGRSVCHVEAIVRGAGDVKSLA
jgi:hypothetical protein